MGDNGGKSMKVTIDLTAGPASYWQGPTKNLMDRNIDAVERALEGKPLVCDTNFLIYVKSILSGIREQLPDV